ncbi:hypothetical protein A2U01_0108322, partial [Trifolium medium]|nr:hypothetical protein [Trifolium medium]
VPGQCRDCLRWGPGLLHRSPEKLGPAAVGRRAGAGGPVLTGR